MKDDRPGTLVCACREDGKIVLHAPYDCEDVLIMAKREKRAQQKKRKTEENGDEKPQTRRNMHENMDAK